MRLDKFLSITATATRSEAGKAARNGRIKVNGIPCKSAAEHIDPDKDAVEYCGELVAYRKDIGEGQAPFDGSFHNENRCCT